MSDLPLRACMPAPVALSVPVLVPVALGVPVPVPVPVPVSVPDLHLPIHSTRFRPLMDIQRNISEIFATIFHCQDVSDSHPDISACDRYPEQYFLSKYSK